MVLKSIRYSENEKQFLILLTRKAEIRRPAPYALFPTIGGTNHDSLMELRLFNNYIVPTY